MKEGTMPRPRLVRFRFFLAGLLAITLLLTAAAWAFLHRHAANPDALPARAELPATTAARVDPDSSAPAGPPWRYGRADARFTVVEYADLECPFCRAYFAVLKRWIDEHPEAAWQWHHLPLSMHEPAASADARLVECAGESGGPAAFWQAAEWVYAHTRGDGQGLPEGLSYPELTPDAQQCLDSERPDAVIRAQAAEAAQQHIAAAPTLRLQDRQSGKTLLLRGPVDGDALLSAIDLLAAGGADAPSTKEMPAEPIGDMPR
jgi:protein-disulfide isomerase